MTDTEIIVRYAETDRMGIVHHSVYAVWFEAARTDYMEKAGYPYPEIEKKGILLPLTNLQCTYREGARYGDTVLVKTVINKITPVRIVLEYQARRKSDNKLLAEGTTTHAWTNTELQIINLKKILPELYSLFESAADGEKQDR